MKDVPTQLAMGIEQAAVLKRGNPKDLLVLKGPGKNINDINAHFIVATSSIRRKAQWLHRYPNHVIENLRGNVNTRLQKLKENHWDAAIFAAAGLERINLRPENSAELDWMLPAPSQGAIMLVCRQEDSESLEICKYLNDDATSTCAKIERDFLRTLLGGCSTPIAALAEIEEDELFFRGNILTPDGTKKAEIEKILPIEKVANLGKEAAEELLASDDGKEIIETIRNDKK